MCRAQILLRQGNADAAAQIYAALKDVEAENVGGYALLRLCDCYRARQRYQDSIALAQSLIERYSETDPVLAGWAGVALGSNLHEIGHLTGDYSQAIRVLWSIARYYTVLEDRGPALQARSELGEIFKDHFAYRISDLSDVVDILSQDGRAEDVLTEICAVKRALWGEGDLARERCDILSWSDDEKPLFGFELACAELESVVRGRTFDPSVLAHAEALGTQMSRLYPEHHYLAAKFRLALSKHYSAAARHQEAEELLCQVARENADTSLVADAYYAMASNRMAQKDNEGALMALQEMRRLHPYSDKDDAALGKMWLAQMLLGRSSDAGATLAELQRLYPESVWNAVAGDYRRVMTGEESAGL